MLVGARWILGLVQIVLLVVDLMFNVIVGVFLTYPQAQVAIYIVQVLCLLLAAGTLCVQIFSSWFCLSGFFQPVFARFGCTVFVWFIYFGFTLGIHVWAITQWFQDNDATYLFTTTFRAIFTVQRMVSYFYYYLMFRKACNSTSPDSRNSRNNGQMAMVDNQRNITVLDENITKDGASMNYSRFPGNSPTEPRLRI